MSEDWLQTLFDGVLGAVIGAIAAMAVLVISLVYQTVGLRKQLEKQDDHHQEQIRVQREENARARIHESAAELLGHLNALVELSSRPPKERTDALDSLALKLKANLNRLSFDLGSQHHDFYLACHKWFLHLVDQNKALWEDFDRDKRRGAVVNELREEIRRDAILLDLIGEEDTEKMRASKTKLKERREQVGSATRHLEASAEATTRLANINASQIGWLSTQITQWISAANDERPDEFRKAYAGLMDRSADLAKMNPEGWQTATDNIEDYLDRAS